ncbi:restriction endonuclease [Halorubrum sp. GN12_10-3_MGM]|uniref:restriction endonuclease n=1 Tax=Halorubrum sp. GN12_10-3_MGM TaxID=2518113 RepID=UPI0013051346|nr:restriction endonuclease [Halorubrum sp. GN12_10-3_MGM]
MEDRYDSKEEALEVHRENGATDQYDNVRFPIRAMIQRASGEDYVWVNEGSEYALCHIESDWKQHPVSTDETDEWTRNDIHNYRDATWRIIEPALVPGYIKRYFAAPRVPTMARPKGGKTESAKRYTTELFNENPDQITEFVDLAKVTEQVEKNDLSRVFDLLDPVETEDIVIDYLQSQGWHVVKSSTSRAQPGIECVLRRVESEPETAYAQVKSGSSSVNVEELENLTDDATVYIHQYEEPAAALSENIVWVSPTQIQNHIVANPGYLPSHTLFKLQLGLEY